MKKRFSNFYIPFFCLAIFNHLALNAQIQTGEFPPSFYQKAEQNQLANAPVQRINVSDDEIDSLKANDLLEAQMKDIPWRFGSVKEVDFTLSNSGEWVDRNDGTSQWTLSLQAKDAHSLNLNFDLFFLAPQTKLFIYNKDYSDVLGALTHKNNKQDSLFACRPIKGDQITLELITPTAFKSQNLLSIHQVVYGYRNIFEKAAKSFGSAGVCNNNVRCTDGDRWQDVKRSVVMILRANNSRWCTGALINNVAQDSTPFILTASHCGLQTNSVFIFNYESPNCSPSTDGVLNQSISGAILRADNAASDFTLFELSATPPSSYQVFYAGWSTLNQASQRSTAIHHPSGDVKKISFDRDSVSESSYYAPGNTHWQVSNWEEGTTQTGSSGSPLFDQNQRIVGQLHGGDAACGNNLQDYYGKFSYSWSNSTNPSSQLQTWLDPSSINPSHVDGLDPNPAAFNYDLELLQVFGLSAYSCDTNQIGTLVLKNKGNQDLTFIQIQTLNNGVSQGFINWNGTLKRNEVANITLNQLPYINGLNRLEFRVNSIGANTDQASINDTLRVETYINKLPTLVTLTLKTDDYGSETSWEIIPTNTNNFTLKSEPFPDVNGGSLYTESLCLYDSCFTLVLSDDYGDGFNGSFGNGYLLLTDSNGDTLVFENNFRGSQKTFNFCLNVSTSLAEKKNANASPAVYPNPVLAGEKLKLSAEVLQNADIRLLDLRGRILVQTKGRSLNVPQNLSTGVYFLEIREESRAPQTVKVLVK